MEPSSFPILHDLHCHSFLSACCGEEACTAPAIFALAKAMGYDTLCLTDHMWDPAVPGASDWLDLALIAIVLPAIICPLLNEVCRKLGWVKDGDLKLE